MNEVIAKYVAQIRFVPTMALYDQLFNIAASLEKSEDFGNWKATRNPDSALLFSEKTRTGLNVSNNSISIITESADVGQNLVTELSKYSTLFLDSTNITDFGHTGVRRTSVYETTVKYTDYVEKFLDAFMNSNDEMKEIAFDSVEDTLYVVEGIKDGFGVRVKFAPLTADQFDVYYGKMDFTPKDFALKKETNIFIDVDVYSESEKDYSKTLEDLQSIFDTQSKMFSDIEKLIKEKTF